MENFYYNGEDLNCPVGTILFKDGESFFSNDFKISYVKSGEIAYLKKTRENKYLKLQFTENEIIGIECLYNTYLNNTTSLYSSAAAMVIKNANLYQWTKENFDLMIIKNIDFAIWSIISLSRHLRKLDQAVIDLKNGKLELVSSEDIMQGDASIQFYGAYGSYEQDEKESLYNLAFFSKEDYVSDNIWDKFGQEFKEGEIICKEGDPGDNLYLIVEGQVLISKDNTSLYNTLKEGDIFGEMAIFEDKSRFATVTATIDTKVLALSKDNFVTLFQFHHKWLLNLIESFAKRINHLYREIDRSVKKN